MSDASMKTKTIFISGPMTGIEDYNFPAFNAAAEKLRAEGYAVVSPATLFGGDTDIEYETMLKVDLAAMAACDVLYALAGWEDSNGSMREVLQSRALCRPIRYQVDEL